MGFIVANLVIFFSMRSGLQFYSAVPQRLGYSLSFFYLLGRSGLFHFPSNDSISPLLLCFFAFVVLPLFLLWHVCDLDDFDDFFPVV